MKNLNWFEDQSMLLIDLFPFPTQRKNCTASEEKADQERQETHGDLIDYNCEKTRKKPSVVHG